MPEESRAAISTMTVAIFIATSIPALRVVRFLEQLIEIHGKPAAIRCDNGPELTSYAFTGCAKREDDCSHGCCDPVLLGCTHLTARKFSYGNSGAVLSGTSSPPRKPSQAASALHSSVDQQRHGERRYLPSSRASFGQ